MMTIQHKTYRSDITAAVHETAKDLYEVGLIDKRTMDEVDALCVASALPLSPAAIKAIPDTA